MDESLYKSVLAWFERKGWQPHPFQLEVWQKYDASFSGLINAPTGSGKTYSALIPILVHGSRQKTKGIKAIWICPIRALAKEIEISALRAIDALGMDWSVGVRTGDTSQSDRRKQKLKPPDILITTPESLHLMLASPKDTGALSHLDALIVDEWHELLGSKRGVQMELALSRLRAMNDKLKVWGISATIGNLEEAKEVLLGCGYNVHRSCIVKAKIKKETIIKTIIPAEVETYPWSGHLGIQLLPNVLDVIKNSKSTLVFTNTRAQCEIWYQKLLEADPDLAGVMAMHHGSMSKELRSWVEEALHDCRLSAVVCTSSLDLGVDFRPVESIVQVGSPKGVARFLQRAGRSGHRPGAVSQIHFLPTNSLELIEAAALKEAIEKGKMESRMPVIRAFDVLAQYLVTIAVGSGLRPDNLFREIITTHAFSSLSHEEWQSILGFVVSGGSLSEYNEYKKLAKGSDGIYRIINRSAANRHRMSIGTIVGDGTLSVRYVKGGKLGTIEEWFVAQLHAGDVFWFAGKPLEFVRIKDMTVYVKKSKSNKGKVPAWMGGRMPLSSQLSAAIRQKIDDYIHNKVKDDEIKALAPLLDIQRERSILPDQSTFLIEKFESREGYHLLIYPFEGRFVHEGLGALLAFRISQIKPITFSIAMNDYGLELLSDQEIPLEESIENGLFDTKHLGRDIGNSINAVELAKRRFRDIASIAGLVFKGYPGREKREKHLQSSSQLIFKVLQDYEPDNLLYLQAFEEARYFELEEVRLRDCLERLKKQDIKIISPGRFTPFAFPIIVDRLRERMSSEQLDDRIKKMKLYIEKG